MDYLGSDVGIHVSDDGKCWAVWKKGNTWEKKGSTHTISEIPDIDGPPVNPETELSITCRLLGQQNPKIRFDLRDAVKRSQSKR